MYSRGLLSDWQSGRVNPCIGVKKQVLVAKSLSFIDMIFKSMATLYGCDLRREGFST
jgi:hypothetical protein